MSKFTGRSNILAKAAIASAVIAIVIAVVIGYDKSNFDGTQDGVRYKVTEHLFFGHTVMVTQTVDGRTQVKFIAFIQ